jgi:branched-chain amino acid transport system ATP-binding protein
VNSELKPRRVVSEMLATESATTARMGDVLLQVSDVVGGYGAGTVLNGVTLQVGRGEAVCVLGPNGAGKTTLLRSVYRMIRIDRGDVTLDGEDLWRLPPYEVARRGVAHVPEGRGVFSGMSVADNLRVGGYLTRTPRERADRMALVLDLFPALKARQRQVVSTMSGGERSMVGLAMALMASPRLLLLDEPSLGLSPKLADGIFEQLAKLREAERELAILLVEQKAVEALELCDWAYVLSSGEMLLDGPSMEVIGDARVETAFLGA